MFQLSGFYCKSSKPLNPKLESFLGLFVTYLANRRTLNFLTLYILVYLGKFKLLWALNPKPLNPIPQTPKP